MLDIKKLAEKIVAKDRRALSRAITLVESSRADHREQAVELVQLLHNKGRQALQLVFQVHLELANPPSLKLLEVF